MKLIQKSQKNPDIDWELQICKQCMSVHPDLIRHLLGYSQALRRTHFVRLRVPAERLIVEPDTDVFL